MLVVPKKKIINPQFWFNVVGQTKTWWFGQNSQDKQDLLQLDGFSSDKNNIVE